MNAEHLTDLLNRWRSGDAVAAEEAMNIAYPVLREIARAQLKRNPMGVTLKSTELAHEAFLRMCEAPAGQWQSRAHFFAFAARVIRFVTIDMARERSAHKRGHGLQFVPLELFETDVPTLDLSWDWLGIDAALSGLAQDHPDCAQVVELKFFSGLNTAEIAQVCGSSDSTVVRQWRFARAWLADRLQVAGGVAP
jgi:RNA polymerase sigma factor (TIGR02999 family)